MLIVKVCIVLLTFFHGGRVRLLLQEKRNVLPGRVALIRRWLRAEAFLMICVLIASGWLANLPPADM
jgi:putative copper export protein